VRVFFEADNILGSSGLGRVNSTFAE